MVRAPLRRVHWEQRRPSRGGEELRFVARHMAPARVVLLPLAVPAERLGNRARLRARVPISPGRRPNKRLKLKGAAKQGRIPLVRQLTIGNGKNARRAAGLSARSLSAIR